MDRDASKLFDVQWVAQCARRLLERWPRADPVSLEEAAVELWEDESLRVVPDTQTSVKQAMQGQFDDSFRKAAIDLLCDIAGLPAAPANRMITGIEALRQGKTMNPAAAVFGYQDPHP